MAEPAANIASHLAIMAESHPDTLAVVVQGRQGADGTFAYDELTALELERESNRIARGLREIGIDRGGRTVLMVTPGIEFFVLTFALFKAGAIPVMVDPGMGVKKLKQCLDEAEPEAFIGISKAHAARVVLGWGKKSNRINVTVGRKWFWGGYGYADLRSGEDAAVLAEVDSDALAAILFTSGSTGIPKGVEYTHGMFQAQVDALRRDYGIAPGEKDLATFPLFALFGPALGMGSVVPDMDASKPITANPEHIIAAIHDYETTNLFASPALLEKVGRHGAAHDVRFPSLKRVISAGAPADPASLARFAGLVDEGVSIWPSYGATEALPVARISHQELIADTEAATEQGAGICVGRPLEAMDVKIVAITDDPIGEWREESRNAVGEIGEICVRGPVVTRSYYRRPDATASAKISLSDESDFYHRMGDVGYLDDQGRLWFCGRKAHRVVTESDTLFTIPCERIFNTHPIVRRTALVGVGKVPVLCVELQADHRKTDTTILFDELRAIGKEHSQTKSIQTFLVHPGFPMDVRHNAKIFREELATWVGSRLT
jgi:olefin beta-lactone synthetase